MNAGGIQQAPISGGVTSQTSGLTTDSDTNSTMFGTIFTGTLKSDDQPLVIEEPVSEQQDLINMLQSFLNTDSLEELEKMLAQQVISTDDQVEVAVDELIPATVKDIPSLLNLIAGFIEEGLLPELELDLEECLVNPEQVLSINLLDLYSLIKQIDTADVEEWTDSKAAGMAEAVKLAKIQLLGSDTKPQDIPLTKELKQLLENIGAKLEKLSVTNFEEKKSNNPSFVEKNSRISLDALRSTYTRIIGVEGNSSEESKPIIIKTNEGNQSTLPFQMSKLEQYVLTTEKNGQPVDQEQFIKQFEKIMNKASFTGTNGMQKLLIKLNPEHLGALRIEIIQKDTGLTAKIMATTSKGKEMLETQLQALKQSFAGQGILVDKIDVSQTTSFQERFTPKDADSHQQRHQTKEQPNEESEESQNEFTNRFEEALVNYEI